MVRHWKIREGGNERESERRGIRPLISGEQVNSIPVKLSTAK